MSSGLQCEFQLIPKTEGCRVGGRDWRFLSFPHPATWFCLFCVVAALRLKWIVNYPKWRERKEKKTDAGRVFGRGFPQSFGHVIVPVIMVPCCWFQCLIMECAFLMFASFLAKKLSCLVFFGLLKNSSVFQVNDEKRFCLFPNAFYGLFTGWMCEVNPKVTFCVVCVCVWCEFQQQSWLLAAG